MAAYRRVYDSRHLQDDCQETGSAPEPYARLASMGYLFKATIKHSAASQTHHYTKLSNEKNDSSRN